MNNREIKFRALSDEVPNSDFIYGLLYYNVVGEYIIKRIDGISKPCKPNTIGMYSGLSDKYGTKIYEGDIVKCGYGIGAVVFNHGCFMVEWIDDKEANIEFLFSRDGHRVRKGEDVFEVIGNIHQNSEFLK